VNGMRLVEFLIHLLEAQAQTLHRLAALFGDEILLHMLEESGDRIQEETAPARFQATWFEASKEQYGFSSPYAQLEGSVHDFKLPSPLEFHLWAYPHYRAFIESGIELDSRIPGPGGDAGMQLVDEAVAQAEEWVKKLPIAPEFRLQAQTAAHVPWLRFRTNVLKRIGKRPLGPVY
jgi:hypothetical protein